MDKEAIFLQLDRIFTHELFKSSKRSVSFLKYVCSQTLEGSIDQIKEYSIAVEAFGLDHNFDQQLNPRIRVEAKRLRDRLTQYYASDGEHDEIIISLPKGTYIPEFRYNESRKAARTEELPYSGSDVEFIFDFGKKLLAVVINKSPGPVFSKYDYLMTGLLRQLFIRSNDESSPGIDRKDRVHARVAYTLEKDAPGIKVLLPDQGNNTNIYTRIFPFPDRADITQFERMIFQLADYLISHCQTDQ